MNPIKRISDTLLNLFRKKDNEMRDMVEKLYPKIVETETIQSTSNKVDLKKMGLELAERDDILVKTKLLWEHTFNSVSDLIIVIDSNKNIVNVNKTFLDHFNFKDRDKVIGKTTSELCYDVGLDKKTMSNICRFIKDDREELEIYNSFNKKWYIIHYSVLSVPEINEQGYILLLKDVTSIKKELEKVNCRQGILKQLNTLSEKLLLGDRWEDHIHIILKSIATYLNADGAHISKIDGNRINMIYGWNVNDDHLEKREDEYENIIKHLNDNPNICINSKKMKSLNCTKCVFGYKSCLNFPIIDSDGVWGVVSFFSNDEMIDWDSEEIDMGNYISKIISIDMSKRKLSKKINIDNILLKDILDKQDEYIFRLDQNLNIIFANKPFSDSIGTDCIIDRDSCLNVFDIIEKEDELWSDYFLNLMSELKRFNRTNNKIYFVYDLENNKKIKSEIFTVYNGGNDPIEYQCLCWIE